MTRVSALLMGMLLAASAGVRADIFQFVDESGTTHFTNVPVDPRFEFLLAGPKEKTRSGDFYDRRLLAAASKFDAVIASAAAESRVEPELLRAVIVVESGFNSRAISKAGAAGLMQLMPETARRYGVGDRFDPAQNVHAGARHLKSLISRYDNDIELALAAYNAGENAVDRCGRCIPRYRETQSYVPKVLQMYQRLRDQVEAG